MKLVQRKTINLGNVGAGETSVSVPGDLNATRPAQKITKMTVSVTLANNANDKRIKVFGTGLSDVFDSNTTLNGQTGDLFFIFESPSIDNGVFLTVWKDDVSIFARLVDAESSAFKLTGESDD